MCACVCVGPLYTAVNLSTRLLVRTRLNRKLSHKYFLVRSAPLHHPMRNALALVIAISGPELPPMRHV